MVFTHESVSPTVSSRLLMGGRLEITLFSHDPSTGRRALEAAFSEVARLERLLSRFLADSELSRVNRLAASGPVAADPELIALLQQSLIYSHLTDGAFDVAARPSQRGGYRHLHVDTAHATIAFGTPHLQIDLGAIGKGYAIDQAVAVLKRHGIVAALVSFGSTTYGLGSPPGRDHWRTAIRHPAGRDRAVDVIPLRDRALSTSGNYEQGGHIIDPRSGAPAAGAASASVLAPTATASDALSTAAFVLGPSAHLNRRQFVTGALALIGWAMLPPLPALAITYLTPEEAAVRLLPEADAWREEALTLTPEQRQEVEQRLGSKIRDTRYAVWIASRQGEPAGYGVVLNVIGKEQPITFMVAVSPSGVILGIEVLIYRESQGAEVRAASFMRQFVGKTLEAPLKLHRDIDSISGATLSSRSTTFAAKKALALVGVVYRRAEAPTP
jgi:thiamine biosynthesis lipoprotein ApbE/Na+-translocating ferredoxin:NAD+ oxidoreductase RnfG subunit